MSLRFIESFDHLDVNTLSQKWNKYDSGTPNLIMDSNGRRGSGALKIAGGSTTIGYINKIFNNQATWIVGFAFKVTEFSTGDISFLQFLDGSTVQASIKVGIGGALTAYRSTNTLLGNASSGVTLNEWNFLEAKITINGTTGAIELRKNGTTILNLTNINTRVSANNYANSIKFGGDSYADFYLDDIYICDAEGSTNNAFLGDVRIDAYLPTGNGNSSQFIGSDSNSTDNYLLVNEVPPNGDTSYVQSSTANDIDLYTFNSMSHTPANIFGLQINMMTKKDDAGTRTLAGVIRISSTNYAGTAQGLSTSYSDVSEIHETDPSTDAVWTKTGFNAAEFGIKCVS